VKCSAPASSNMREETARERASQADERRSESEAQRTAAVIVVVAQEHPGSRACHRSPSDCPQRSEEVAIALADVSASTSGHAKILPPEDDP
jgi:hypothetical protein